MAKKREALLSARERKLYDPERYITTSSGG
jgi:hypothetical protein